MKTKGLNFLEALAANENFMVKLASWDNDESYSIKSMLDKDNLYSLIQVQSADWEIVEPEIKTKPVEMWCSVYKDSEPGYILSSLLRISKRESIECENAVGAIKVIVEMKE